VARGFEVGTELRRVRGKSTDFASLGQPDVREPGGARVSSRWVLGNVLSRTEGLSTSDTATRLSVTYMRPKKRHTRCKSRKVGNRKQEVRNHMKEGGKTRAGSNTSAAHSCPFGSLYI
jgi:hypothetical protein